MEWSWEQQQAASKSMHVSSMQQTHVMGVVEHVGLGLRLERSTKGPDVYIQEIVPGFAAHENGRLQVKDVVVAVDHIPLTEMELEAVKQLTIGEEGTLCTLQVQRLDHYFQVTLLRKFPERLDRSNTEALHAISDRFSPSKVPPYSALTKEQQNCHFWAAVCE